MSFPSPKGATVLEYAYCTTSNATRRSGMENEYMKVAYDIIHNTLVLIIASSMHSTVGSGNAESTTTVRYAYSSTHTASSASQ